MENGDINTHWSLYDGRGVGGRQWVLGHEES